MPHSITSFTASSRTINRGESTTLRWVAAGRYQLTVSDAALGVYLKTGIDSSSITVSPTRTTEYVLDLFDPNTVDPHFTFNTTRVTVTVLEIAVIDLFSGPSAIDHGASANLVWRTTHATIVSISGVLSSSSDVDGNISVSPTETTTYTLRARNTSSGKVVTKDVTITVRDPVIIEPPIITPPTLAVSITGTTSDVNEGVSRRFRVSVTGTGVGTPTYSWSVDGDATIRGSSTGASVLVRANQVGSSGGSYSISVEVTKGELDASDTTSDISVIDTTVTIQPPTAATLTVDITGSTSAINEGRTRSFTASIRGTATGAITYRWSVNGDATIEGSSTNASASIRTGQVGSSGGSFTVSVTITRQAKSASDTTSSITVSDSTVFIPPVTTTRFAYIWRRGLTHPSTPSNGRNIPNHQPSGWSRDKLSATNINNVYRSRRQETLVDGVFQSATYWEGASLWFKRLNPRVYSGSDRINLSSGSPRVRRIYIGNSQVSER